MTPIARARAAAPPRGMFQALAALRWAINRLIPQEEHPACGWERTERVPATHHHPAEPKGSREAPFLRNRPNEARASVRRGGYRALRRRRETAMILEVGLGSMKSSKRSPTPTLRIIAVSPRRRRPKAETPVARARATAPPRSVFQALAALRSAINRLIPQEEQAECGCEAHPLVLGSASW